MSQHDTLTQPPADEVERIIRSAVAAMPNTNPLVADDLIAGHTMHTEAEDIVAIWRAALSATQPAQAAQSNVVPGVMHCARCNFKLNRVTLYMGNGAVGAGDNKTEPCPNGCGPLWPVTWEQEARDAYKTCEDLFERAHKAEKQLEAQAAQEPMVRFCPGCGSVGYVPDSYRDCCPDGGHARMIPESLARRCHDLFRLALDSTIQAQAAQSEPIELLGVQEAIKEGNGHWCPCSGCHELNEGYDTGPFSKVFGCALGGGCSECGGLGAIWDNTDYDGMARHFLESESEQAAQGAGEVVRQIKGESFECPHAWRDATEEAFNVTPEQDRRVLYTHPRPAQPAPVVPDDVLTSGPCAPDCHAWDGRECHNDMCPNPSALRWAEQVHLTNREPDMSVAARDVLAERQRQISQEGWTPDHDDQHDKEDLESAAACYALPNHKRKVGSSPFTPDMPTFWPWDRSWWKPGDRRRELVKACALLLAAIERRDRAATPTPPAQAAQQGEKA